MGLCTSDTISSFGMKYNNIDMEFMHVIIMIKPQYETLIILLGQISHTFTIYLPKIISTYCSFYGFFFVQGFVYNVGYITPINQYWRVTYCVYLYDTLIFSFCFCVLSINLISNFRPNMSFDTFTETWELILN